MTFVGLSQRSRRILGTVLGFVALAALVVPSAQASGPAFKPAILDVTGWKMAGPSAGGVALAGVPLPTSGDGIGPGSYLLIDQTDGNSYICTANFVWDGDGGPYLGAAGHCFLPAADTNGNEVERQITPNQYVTRVRVCVGVCAFGGQLGAVLQGDFRDLGDVVYARQQQGSRNDVGHDFGLVEIPESLGSLIRQSVPVWGGPKDFAPIGVNKPVCLYGNAAGLGEVFVTKARFGLGSSTHDGAWYANLPSFQGDSGSALVNCPGLSGTTAVGILTHLATDGSGVIAGTTVAQAIDMYHADNQDKSIALVSE